MGHLYTHLAPIEEVPSNEGNPARDGTGEASAHVRLNRLAVDNKLASGAKHAGAKYIWNYVRYQSSIWLDSVSIVQFMCQPMGVLPVKPGIQERIPQAVPLGKKAGLYWPKSESYEVSGIDNMSLNRICSDGKFTAENQPGNSDF